MSRDKRWISGMSNKTMLNKQKFQQHQFLFGALALLSFLFINNTINATTQTLELYRSGDNATGIWEPFVWEYTSAISSFIIFPMIIWLIRNEPIMQNPLRRSLLVYSFAAVIYSLLHVLIMVLFREGVYWLVGGNYDFGDWQFELFYEMQKDIWSFFFWLVICHGYQFITSRWLGEATPIQQADSSGEPEQSASAQLDRLIVKKLGKEFIIDAADIQWMESAGNYVNLYVNDRIYPVRATLSALSEQLAHHGICRIHRSYSVNVKRINSITPLASGDSEVLLVNNKTLKLSRRYKDNFRLQLGTS